MSFASAVRASSILAWRLDLYAKARIRPHEFLKRQSVRLLVDFQPSLVVPSFGRPWCLGGPLAKKAQIQINRRSR
jgi:hypothetical protein